MVQPTETRGDGRSLAFDPTTMALYVLATEQIVGWECPSPALGDGGTMDGDAGADASVPPEDGGAFDGGEPAASDAAVALDAAPGTPDGATALDGSPGPADAASPDAAMPDDMAPMEPPMPRCPDGVMPEAIRGSVVHTVVRPRVSADGAQAALVMPVPARPDVHVAAADLFTTIGALMTPRETHQTIEIEDPTLGRQCDDPKFVSSGSGGGCGPGGGSADRTYVGPSRSTGGGFYDPDTETRSTRVVESGDGIVEVEDVLATDDFDVTALNASTPDALFRWLDDNGFGHDAEDDEAFSAYADEGAWFVAVRVHPDDMRGALVGLAPIVVSHRGSRIPLMHRLQYHAEGGTLITDAFVMSATRMDAADGSATTGYAAPTGFGSAGPPFGVASGWLTRLTITRIANVELDDSWLEAVAPLEQRPLIEHVTEVRIPTRCTGTTTPASSSRSSSGGCACIAAVGRASPGSALPIAAALGWLLLRRRPRRRDFD